REFTVVQCAQTRALGPRRQEDDLALDVSIVCPIWIIDSGDSMNAGDAIPTSSSTNNLIVIALADNDGDPSSAGLAGGAAERRRNRRRAFHQSGDEVIDGAATTGSQPATTRLASRPTSISKKTWLR